MAHSSGSHDVTITGPASGTLVNDTIKLSWTYDGFQEDSTTLTDDATRKCSIRAALDRDPVADDELETRNCPDTSGVFDEQLISLSSLSQDETQNLNIVIHLAEEDATLNSDSGEDNRTFEYDTMEPRISSTGVDNSPTDLQVSDSETLPDRWYNDPASGDLFLTTEVTDANLITSSRNQPRIVSTSWADRTDLCSQGSTTLLHPQSGDDVFGRDLRQAPSFSGNHGDLLAFHVKANDTFRETSTPFCSGPDTYAVGVDEKKTELSDLSNSTTNSFPAPGGQLWVAGDLTLSIDAKDPVSGPEFVDFTRSPTDGGPDLSPLRVSNSSGDQVITYSTTSQTDAPNAEWQDNTVYEIGAVTDDRAGNHNETTAMNFTVGVDNDPPIVNFTGDSTAVGPDGRNISFTAQELSLSIPKSTLVLERETSPGSGTFTEITGQADIKTNASAAGGWIVNHTVSENLDEGSYDFRLSAEDDLNNFGSHTETIDVDFTNPEFTDLNAVLADGSDFDDNSSDLQFHHDGTYWITGQNVNYTTEASDSTSGVVVARFQEAPGDHFVDTDRRVTGTDTWFLNRPIDAIVKNTTFALNASVEDEAGNIGHNWADNASDTPVPNLTLGVDVAAPDVELPSPSDTLRFVDPSSISVDAVEGGSGVNVTSPMFHNMSWKPPGATSFSPLNFSAGDYSVQNTSENRVRFTFHPDSYLEEGTYEFALETKDNLTHTSNETETVDLVNITVHDTGPRKQRAGVNVTIDGNDTRLSEATFRFIDTADANPVTAVDSQTEWTQVVPLGLGTTPKDDVIYIDATEGDVPLGEYHLKANVTLDPDDDGEADAEEAFFLIEPDPIEIGPKLEFEDGPFRGGGEVNATIRTAFHGTEDPQFGNCLSPDDGSNPHDVWLCDVTRVQVEGLFDTSDGTEWRTFENLTSHDRIVSDDTYFEYDFRHELTDSEAQNFLNQVRIESNVTGVTGPSGDNQHETVDVELVSGPGATLLDPVRPTEGDVNGTGDVEFAVDAQRPETIDSKDMAVHLDVRDGAGDLVIEDAPMNGPDAGTGRWRLNVTEVSGEDVRKDAALDDDGHLVSGNYSTSFRIVDTSGTSNETELEISNTWSVEQGDPVLTYVDIPGTQVADGTRWIGHTVDFNVTVETGFAQLESLDNVTLTYHVGDDTEVDADIDWVPDIPEDARSFSDGEREYQLAGSATVTALGHDDNVLMSLRAEHNAEGPGDDPSEDGVGFENRSATFDARLPTIDANRTFADELGVLTHNESLTASPPSLTLNVSDVGAGFGDDFASKPGIVEATFHRRGGPNGTKVLNWTETSSGFEFSDEAPAVSYNLSRESPGNWTLDDTADQAGLPALFGEIEQADDRFLVNVTATDRANNTGNLTHLSIAADLGAPQIPVEDLTQSTNGTEFNRSHVSVNWGLANESVHGEKPGNLWVKANITEDADLTSTAPVLEMPNGSTRLVASDLKEICSPGDAHANEVCTWNLTGANLSQVGTYRLGVVAEDAVGNLGSTRNATDDTTFLLNFSVVDTIAPEVEEVFFEPKEIGPESNVRAKVRAFDDGTIQNATATWVNTTGENATTFGTFPVTDCSAQDDGTAVCTDESADHDVPFDVGDTWEVRWTVNDTTGKTSGQASATFEVLEDAPPFLQRVDPPSDVDFIGDSPLVIQVEEQNLPDQPDDNVAVDSKVGNESFSPYQDWTAESTEGGFVHFVNVTPPDLDEGQEWTVRVNVTEDTAEARSTVEEYTLAVDRQAPSLDVTIDGSADVGGTTWISPDSTFNVDASDAAAGIPDGGLTYTVDDGDPQNVTDGTFTLDTGSGSATVTVTATDGVGNEESTTRAVQVDAGVPSVSVDTLARTVEATVTDDGVGLAGSSVTLLYRLADSSSYQSTPMNAGAGDTWTGSIPDNIRGEICVVVEAEDELGNTGRSRPRSDPACFGTENQAPSLSLTAPAAGATVTEDLTVEWQASDPDGDDVSLTFTLASEDQDTGPQTLGDGSVSNTGSATFDVTGFDDGNYTLTARASDGAAQDSAEVSLAVLNTPVVQPRQVPSAEIESQDTVRVEVDVSHPFKTVTDVTAIVERDGEVVAEEPMEHVEGDTYALDYEPEEPGSHEVSVRVTYADGTSQTFDVASFNAVGPVDEGVGAQLVALVVLGAIVVGVGSYGAFGRWTA